MWGVLIKMNKKISLIDLCAVLYLILTLSNIMLNEYKWLPINIFLLGYYVYVRFFKH